MASLSLLRIGRLSAVQFGCGQKGVLFLYPPGEERKGCVRLVQQVAQQLTTSDCAAVCFDYYGDGDSPGDFCAMNLQTLREDIAAACAWMDARFSSYTVCAIRLAAGLGLEFVPRGVRIVLLAPVFDSSRWLKETVRRSRFREGDHPQREGDIDGYVYGREFFSQLEEGVPLQEGTAGRQIRVLSYGPGSAPGRDVRGFCNGYGVEPLHVNGLPFWLQGESGEYGSLPEALAQLLMEE